MRRWLAFTLIAACSGAPTRIGAQPSWRQQQSSDPQPRPAQPTLFAPKTEAATAYNEPIHAPTASPLGDAVLAAVRDAAVKAHVAVPVADERLFRACAEIAEVVPEDSVLDYKLEAFALERNGIIEPAPPLLIVWGDVAQAGPMVDQLKSALGEMVAAGGTRFGVGTAARNADGTGALVFALVSSHVTTQPIPRAVAPTGAFPIDAAIDAGFHDPELFVTHDDGAIEQIFVAAHDAAFKAQVACGKHRGRQQIEIMASNAGGATVLANFPVWCGQEPPQSITIDPSTDDSAAVTPDQAEQRLLALLNRDRLAAGLPALLWDDRVAAVARAYAEEMRRTGLVAHISPTSGSPSDRVRTAGIKTGVVLENVAREYGVNGAHAGLMDSPGHRANMMSTAATHVGIGVALGEGAAGRREMLVTELFIRIPPKIDAGQVAELVRQRIGAVQPASVDARLASVAQQLAEGLAAGKTRDQLWPFARKQLDAATAGYARVGSVITAVSDLDQIDGKELVGTRKPDAIGVGIGQGTHPDLGEGAIWIVVLMAERQK